MAGSERIARVNWYSQTRSLNSADVLDAIDIHHDIAASLATIKRENSS